MEPSDRLAMAWYLNAFSRLPIVLWRIIAFSLPISIFGYDLANNSLSFDPAPTSPRYALGISVSIGIISYSIVEIITTVLPLRSFSNRTGVIRFICADSRTPEVSWTNLTNSLNTAVMKPFRNTGLWDAVFRDTPRNDVFDQAPSRLVAQISNVAYSLPVELAQQIFQPIDWNTYSQESANRFSEDVRAGLRPWVVDPRPLNSTEARTYRELAKLYRLADQRPPQIIVKSLRSLDAQLDSRIDGYKQTTLHAHLRKIIQMADERIASATTSWLISTDHQENDIEPHPAHRSTADPTETLDYLRTTFDRLQGNLEARWVTYVGKCLRRRCLYPPISARMNKRRKPMKNMALSSGVSVSSWASTSSSSTTR